MSHTAETAEEKHRQDSFAAQDDGRADDPDFWWDKTEMSKRDYAAYHDNL